MSKRVLLFSHLQNQDHYYYLSVRLLTHWQEPLLYKISCVFVLPEWLVTNSKPVILVKCLLRQQPVIGLVEQIFITKPDDVSFEVKSILEVVPVPSDISFLCFIDKVSSLFGLSRVNLLRRLIPFIKSENVSLLKNLDFPLAVERDLSSVTVLSQKQQRIADSLIKIIDRGCFSQSLLHGVTGSGKSQIYLYLINYLLKQGKSVIFLVPEVSLALNFFTFFSENINTLYHIYAWHSAELKKNSKLLLWQSLLNKDPVLIIGVHQPVFLPISNLGLIIIDEEHEESFIEKQAPFLNTKTIAFLKASFCKIPILLGSATPSISSYYHAKQDLAWNYFYLDERFGSSFPATSIVQLDFKKKNFWLSNELVMKLKDRVLKGEQSILFLNRRGYAACLRCQVCKDIVACKNCSVSLTVYKHSNGVTFLECHYCGFNCKVPLSCDCSAIDNFWTKGLGVEQVCKVLSEVIPDASILKADATVVRKKEWPEKMKDFVAGKINIMVGTKMVCKGYHFPNVTLVGVLWADLDFSFPDYKSREYGIQQLLQVSGRSGRGLVAGEVIIQAMNASIVDQFSTEDSYTNFLEEELVVRKMLKYPPFSKLVFIEIGAFDASAIKKPSELIASLLKTFLLTYAIDGVVLGPARPIIFKRNKKFFEQVMIKLFCSKSLTMVLRYLVKLKLSRQIDFEFWLEV